MQNERRRKAGFATRGEVHTGKEVLDEVGVCAKGIVPLPHGINYL